MSGFSVIYVNIYDFAGRVTLGLFRIIRTARVKMLNHVV